jgi:hypothetical protein
LTPDPVRRSGKKFRAYRAWTFDGYKLRSANPAGGHWTPGVNHAECRRSAYEYSALVPNTWAASTGLNRVQPSRSAHAAPHHRCHCGLYAWHDPARLPGASGFAAEYVYGAILAWGRIEVHGDGLRAEYAEPVLLAYDESQSYKHVRRVQAIGSELGLPVVEVDELEEASKAFGEPVPRELRPDRGQPFEVGPRLALALTAGGMLLASAGLAARVKQDQRRAAATTGRPPGPPGPGRAA